MKKTKQIIPNKAIFKDREKEAEFWEKNYKDAWVKGKPVKVKFTKNLSETINIRLDSQTLLVVRDRAQEKGLGPTQLVRMWIKEKLKASSV